MRRACLATFGLAIAFAGCGSRHELGQVEGTARSAGHPLANAVVTFVPDAAEADGAPRSMAMTDQQGHYRLRTETGQDGAVVGRHRVVVEDLAILSAPRSADGTVLKRPPVRISSSYSQLLKTPLTQEVKPGNQTIDLDLTAGP